MGGGIGRCLRVGCCGGLVDQRIALLLDLGAGLLDVVVGLSLHGLLLRAVVLCQIAEHLGPCGTVVDSLAGQLVEGFLLGLGVLVVELGLVIARVLVLLLLEPIVVERAELGVDVGNGIVDPLLAGLFLSALHFCHALVGPLGLKVGLVDTSAAAAASAHGFVGFCWLLLDYRVEVERLPSPPVLRDGRFPLKADKFKPFLGIFVPVHGAALGPVRHPL